jgi:hypothetical protein
MEDTIKPGSSRRFGRKTRVKIHTTDREIIVFPRKGIAAKIDRVVKRRGYLPKKRQRNRGISLIPSETIQKNIPVLKERAAAIHIVNKKYSYAKSIASHTPLEDIRLQKVELDSNNWYKQFQFSKLNYKIFDVINASLILAVLFDKIVQEIAFIRSNSITTINFRIDDDFETFDSKLVQQLILKLRTTFELKGKIQLKSIKKGSVIISLEMPAEDAEKLYLAIQLHKLKKFGISTAKLVGFNSSDIKSEINTDNIKDKIKTHIANHIENGFEAIESILRTRSKKYNAYIQIKSDYNSSVESYNLNKIDFNTFKIHMNKNVDALLHLVENIDPSDTK